MVVGLAIGSSPKDAKQRLERVPLVLRGDALYVQFTEEVS